MKTVLISSSLSPNSRSLILAQNVANRLTSLGVHTEVVDAKTLHLTPTHIENSKEMIELSQKIEQADNIIIAMGVYNYSMSDSLKIIFDNCFSGAKNKFFGILCAAGGERSYLATTQVTQTCHNQYRMIQLPSVVYITGKAFTGDEITDEGILERLDTFANDFYTIGNKLLR
jgi:NAD(P)H-dependent FMN reductase